MHNSKQLNVYVDSSAMYITARISQRLTVAIRVFNRLFGIYLISSTSIFNANIANLTYSGKNFNVRN